MNFATRKSFTVIYSHLPEIVLEDSIIVGSVFHDCPSTPSRVIRMKSSYIAKPMEEDIFFGKYPGLSVRW